MNDFLARLQNGGLLFDGSMGALIEARGVTTNCPALLNAENPALIRAIHQDYRAAGADVSIANTFGANPIKLRALGLENRLDELIEKGVALAREAGNFALLDIGPTGEFLRPAGNIGLEEMVQVFRACAQAGARAGADGVIIETMADAGECRAAVIAAKETGLPVIASMTFEKNARTLTGNPPECCALILEHAGADAIGINCSGGPEEMLEPLRRMRAVSNLPIVVQPNAGLPALVDGRVVYPYSPEAMAQAMARLAENGANAIGGCCGTRPEHIAAMRPIACPAPEKRILPRYIASARKWLKEEDIRAERAEDADALLDLDDDTNAAVLSLEGLDDEAAIAAIEEAQMLSPLPLLFERGVNARVRLHYTGVPGACPMDM